MWRAAVLLFCGLLGATACSGPDATPDRAASAGPGPSGPAASHGMAASRGPSDPGASSRPRPRTGHGAGSSGILDTSLAGGRYVALGASFTAGPGIPDASPQGPRGCGRSTRNFPTLLAHQLRLTLRDVSCQGATTADVLTGGRLGRPPQISAVRADTDLVTINVGGNDVGYLSSINRFSACNTREARCRPVDRPAMDRGLHQIAPRLQRIVHEVQRRAPHSRIVLVDYLTILPPPGKGCPGVPLTRDQVAFEFDVTRRLNAAVREAATATGAQLTAASKAGRSGHHACGQQPYVENFRPGPKRIPYHPNEAGMRVVADLIAGALRN